jgi:hypothetical protein
MRRAALFAVLMCMLSVSASADGVDSPKRSRVVKKTAMVTTWSPGVVPDCFERPSPRLLSCEPRVNLRAEHSLHALWALEGPPVRRRYPYPAIFEWRYGN